MKKLVLIAVSLLCLSVVCTEREDTDASEVWRRTFEPRLIGTRAYQRCETVRLQADQIVPKTVCGVAPPATRDACDDVINTREEAARMLATRPPCIDRAIGALQRYAQTDPLAASDLAAAYSVRAQREDRPLDLLRALASAEQAMATARDQPAARFNYALIQQALGFTEEAIDAWDRFLELDRSSEWAEEARRHQERLVHLRALDASQRWENHRAALPGMLRSGDRAALARLIQPFPRSAWIYFEEEVLPRWAEEPTEARLREARLYAEELSRRTQDRYALDAVAALERGGTDLREGHRFHRDAIRADRAHNPGAEELFRKAAALLERGGSPVQFSARIGHAIWLSFLKPAPAYQLSRAVEERVGHYPHFESAVRANRAYFLYRQDRYVEALTQYETALARFEELGDLESASSLYSSTLGLYRILGQIELASRAAFLGRNYAIRLPDPQRRNRYLGEAALFALEHAYGAVARSYQNASVRVLEHELASATRPDVADNLRRNLAIALRSRAGILAKLDRFDLATEDLERAIQYGPHDIDGPTSRALQARIEEVRAIALLPRDAEGAVRAFTAAIDLAGQDEYSTFRANLFAQRAGALRNLGRGADAELDLREALRLVRAEEAVILEKRQLGKDEEIWASYFSRFDDTYQVLIRHLVEDGRPEEAFAIAEQARAYEPMNLLLSFGVVARSFHGQLGPEQTLSLADIQQHLPIGTFLVQYAVLDDRTYAWIIGPDTFVLRELNARRTDVVRWSEELQEAVHRRDPVLFETTLEAAHEGLVARVLAEVRPPSPGPVRLVIVPDGAMHGLPFAALRNGRSGRHLIQDAALSIAPSASFHVHSVLRDRELPRSTHPSALLIGNPDLDPGLARAHLLEPLRGAEREVTRIAQDYAPQATVRMGNDATMEEFLRLATQNDIVHVAAHGLVNERVPFRSSLVLAKTAHSEGRMDAEMLLRQLKTDRTRLMVLSACSSAGGLPVGSQGVAPLVRPILSAGVPGVIGTLWDIDDATSAELMVSFHRHYRRGDDAAIALQRAQVEMLTEKPGIAAAMTWAPFQVIGHASSPFAAPDNNRGEPP